MLKITIKHYFDFSGISKTVKNHVHSAEAWDNLRLENGQSNIFAIPEESKAWEHRCYQEPFVQDHAQTISRIANGRFGRINSYGAGPGFLEFFIKRQCPAVYLQCSDYTAKSMDRLRNVFQDADEILTFDLLKDDWRNGDDKTLHVLYRVDTALDNEQWRRVFSRMKASGVKHILFVPCEFLTCRRWLTQKIKYFLWPLMGRKIAFAGFLRSKAQFLDLFAGNYAVEREVEFAGNMRGFLIKGRP